MALWVKKTFGNNEYRDLIHQVGFKVNIYVLLNKAISEYL